MSALSKPTPAEMTAVADAARLVRGARDALRAAVFRLDDGRFECHELQRLYADTAALSATWAGRDVPQFQNDNAFPSWATSAFVEWRRQNGRSY